MYLYAAFYSLLEQLVRISKKPDIDSKFRTKALVFEVLSEIFSSVRTIERTESHAIVDEAKDYLELHFAHPHTVFDLASRYGISAKYFSSIFKKYTGSSPLTYLTDFRMKQAHQLLTTTSCSVKEIGESVGYEDAYYFSRIFKKQFGFAPSDLRRSQIEQAN